MMKRVLTYSILLLATIITGCVEEDSFSNSPQGNYDALWSLIDERYCFFEHAKNEYGLDWNDVYHKYKPQVDAAKAMPNCLTYTARCCANCATAM